MYECKLRSMKLTFYTSAQLYIFSNKKEPDKAKQINSFSFKCLIAFTILKFKLNFGFFGTSHILI